MVPRVSNLTFLKMEMHQMYYLYPFPTKHDAPITISYSSFDSDFQFLASLGLFVEDLVVGFHTLTR